MNRLVALGFLAAVIVSSGCLSMEVDTYVTGDAEIDRMEMEVEMSPMLYEDMDTEEELMEDFRGEEEVFEDVEISQEERDGSHFVNYKLHSPDLEELEEIEVYEENGRIIYEEDLTSYEDLDAEAEDTTTEFSSDNHETTTQQLGTETDQVDTYPDTEMEGFEEMYEDMISVDYRIHMPGEIVETNGEIRDGDTAHYDTETFMETEEIYVESQTDTGIITTITQFFRGLL